ncbi:MAG: sigma 54-interacting transcriptional regulator [Pirellulales bacterium]
MAIPGQLLESELFGHEKGHLRVPTSRKTAPQGTLLLDEVGGMQFGNAGEAALGSSARCGRSAICASVFFRKWAEKAIHSRLIEPSQPPSEASIHTRPSPETHPFRIQGVGFSLPIVSELR